MIQFDNNTRLIQNVNELPNFNGVSDVYLDLETTSGNSKKTALNPWKHCGITGIGITVDDCAYAVYIPINSNIKHWNVPREPVLNWLFDIISNCKRWINHNVKFDAHVLANSGGILYKGQLVDTLTLAKIIDSDRLLRGGYSLTALSNTWLEEDVNKYEQRVKAYLTCCKSKDYGDLPGDIIAAYCGQDVLFTRKLFKYIDRRCPEQCRVVWNTEIKLTPILFKMEREGVCVDPTELKIKQVKTLQEMLSLEESIQNDTGLSLRPHVNDDCYELICNQWGLPVLGWTDDKREGADHNPSFDKDVLASYLRHPQVAKDESYTKTVNQMLKYRQLNTLNSLFLGPFQELQVNGILHGSYNQAVRTGRLSCSKPNMQQNSDDSKKLIHSKPGNAFITADYSQIEFRLIVHYIDDINAITAYNDNPDTDFHQWIAELCTMPRRPAKNVNFMIAFGGGKGKTTTMLAANMELVGHLMEEVINNKKIRSQDRDYAFNELCKIKAYHVYRTYHARLPGIKRTSRKATRRAVARGYVFNAYGRRRHLPEHVAHHAFSSIIQSSAADLIKERTVACDELQDVSLCASVHDESLFQAPIEIARNPDTWKKIAQIMEHPNITFRVPIRINIGVSEKNWSEASSDTAVVEIDR